MARPPSKREQFFSELNAIASLLSNQSAPSPDELERIHTFGVTYRWQLRDFLKIGINPKNHSHRRYCFLLHQRLVELADTGKQLPYGIKLPTIPRQWTGDRTPQSLNHLRIVLPPSSPQPREPFRLILDGYTAK